MKEAIAAKRRANGQSGFTLIELLVVIAILAVLSGVVVFAVSGISNDSQASACKIEARTVKTAAESYRADNTQYATAVSALPVDAAPTLVTYSSTAAGPPTYAWAGDCVSGGSPIAGLPTNP